MFRNYQELIEFNDESSSFTANWLRCSQKNKNDERFVIKGVCRRHDPTLPTQHREVSE